MAGQIYYSFNQDHKDKDRIYITFSTTSTGFFGSLKHYISPENLTPEDLNKMKTMPTFLSIKSGSDYVLNSKKSTIRALPTSKNSLATLVYEKDEKGIAREVLKKDKNNQK